MVVNTSILHANSNWSLSISIYHVSWARGTVQTNETIPTVSSRHMFTRRSISPYLSSIQFTVAADEGGADSFLCCSRWRFSLSFSSPAEVFITIWMVISQWASKGQRCTSRSSNVKQGQAKGKKNEVPAGLGAGDPAGSVCAAWLQSSVMPSMHLYICTCSRSDTEHGWM